MRVGTRGSKLALDQTYLVLGMIRDHHPEINFEVKIIKTSGDEGHREIVGAWVKEVENALLENVIDIAVHSLKDMPTVLHEDLSIGAIPTRADHRDCLVAKDGLKLSYLPKKSKVGTSSLRRAFQISLLRPDLEIIPVHGNIITRMGYVNKGELDAVVLAYAGLQRTQTQDNATQIFSNIELLCAVAQGALAVEIRKNDESLKSLLSAIHDEETASAVYAERSFLMGLGGGCRMPIAAYAEVINDRLHLRGMMFNEAGTQQELAENTGKASEAEALGKILADELLNRF